MKDHLQVIGFDADDTLWLNESYYQETGQKFYQLLMPYLSCEEAEKELFKTEMDNMELYGYGAKAYILSIIETALRVTENRVGANIISEIIILCKELLNKPVVLLDGIADILEQLSQSNYRVIMVTKGDLLDQERKLNKSNIAKYFHHIEIVSDKKESDYIKLLERLSIAPERFLMIGNSLKSDVLPVINIGGYGVHIPHEMTWAHEKTEMEERPDRFWKIEHISELRNILELNK